MGTKKPPTARKPWYETFLGKITIGVIVAVISIVLTMSVAKIKDTQVQSEPLVIASNGVVSFGQKGGITAHTVDINEFPEPKFDARLIAENVPRNDLFETKVLLTISSKTALKNLYLEARAPAIVSLEVVPQRSGPFIVGLSGKRDGFSFTNIPSAYGQYMLVILSRKPDKCEVTYDYE